jgi:hypothetical protein
MTRRTLFAALLALPVAGCHELAGYHSRVKFSLSNDRPAAGEAIEITFDYLDDAPAGTWSMALVQPSSGAVLQEVPVAGASSRVTLTPAEPGGYSVQCRMNGRMIAHRSITVR